MVVVELTFSNITFVLINGYMNTISIILFWNSKIDEFSISGFGNTENTNQYKKILVDLVFSVLNLDGIKEKVIEGEMIIASYQEGKISCRVEDLPKKIISDRNSREIPAFRGIGINTKRRKASYR